MSKTYFSSSSSERLVDGFRQLVANDVEYLVLNTWVDLPDASHGNDVDILIDPEDYHDAIKIFKNVGFSRGDSSHWRIIGFMQLAKKAITTHRNEAIEMFLNTHPKGLAKKIVNPAYKVDEYDSALVDRTPLFYDNMKLDTTNHLNYHTADGSEKMRVNPEAEKYFFETRTKANGFYVASPPCELAHLVSRIVFDYEQKTGGEIPDYYVDRCDKLVKKVVDDKEHDKIFRSVLQQIYFDADELIYNLVTDGEYECIRSQLVEFAQY